MKKWVAVIEYNDYETALQHFDTEAEAWAWLESRNVYGVYGVAYFVAKIVPQKKK